MEPYSVLMSLYKKEHPEYLRLALDSMINQTVKPDEIVLVEDGPLTDELYAVVEEYKDYLTIVVNKTNLGLGLALNEGLKACRNELVARMDTDDISKPVYPGRLASKAYFACCIYRYTAGYHGILERGCPDRNGSDTFLHSGICGQKT